MSPHTRQNGHHQYVHKQVLARTWRKGSPRALLVGRQTGAAATESSMKRPQNIKNGTAMIQ